MERTENRQSENEQTKVAAHTAEAEKNTGAAAIGVSLGKFKDVASLLKAYENLESEFTRRSRRLKELEGKVLKGDAEITRRGAFGSDGKDLGENLSSEKREARGGECKDGGDGICRADTVSRAGKNEKDEWRASDGERARKADEAEIREENEFKNAGEKGGGHADENSDGHENERAGETFDGRESGEIPIRNDYPKMEEIVKEYLLGVMKSRPPVTPASGAAVIAPPRKPKTFEEAGRLMQNGFEL